jgi:hypothetical protein
LEREWLARLDKLCETFREAEAAGAEITAVMDDFTSTFTEIRAVLDHEAWRHVATTVLRDHPLRAYIHQDPFQRRCYEKPRGYAGDAVMLDMIYASDGVVPHPQEYLDATPLGRRIFDHSTRVPESLAVANRRRILSDLIDGVPDGGSVLSIACGHFREAGTSVKVRERRLGRVVGLDFDGQSLKECARSLGEYGVETVRHSIRDLLTGEANLGSFDLVYTAGLYDYLDDTVAQAATKLMFDMVKPGGRCLTANFAPGCPSIGGTEAYMDWWLIYRDLDEVRRFADSIDPAEIADLRTFSDPGGLIHYLELTRG